MKMPGSSVTVKQHWSNIQLKIYNSSVKQSRIEYAEQSAENTFSARHISVSGGFKLFMPGTHISVEA